MTYIHGRPSQVWPFLPRRLYTPKRHGVLIYTAAPKRLFMLLATDATSTGSTRLKFMQYQTTPDLPALAMMPCPLPRKSRRTTLWSPRINWASIFSTASMCLATSLRSITTSPSSWPLRLQILLFHNVPNIHWEAYDPENPRPPQSTPALYPSRPLSRLLFLALMARLLLELFI
jgi:hypothetical protein